MPSQGLIVVKFGGSVLRDPASLPKVAEEIDRWRQQGASMLAVVSALAGRTDVLLAEAMRKGLQSFAVAAHVSQGEVECAQALLPVVQRHTPSTVLATPAALGLAAAGPPLDATLRAVDVALLRALLQRAGVVVVPGFAAVDADGRTVLLGRGGSDLSALFLAHALAARCRLVKDVGGLFAVDPRQGALPRALARASYEELLARGGRVVQPKAVHFAARQGFGFEIAGLGADAATIIGKAEGDAAAG